MKCIPKKSQTEVMGLMIIVVLITFIILFVVSVVYFKPTEDPLNSYLQKEMSSSLISAMLKTDSGCTRDTTMEDLFIDLVKGGSIICDNVFASNLKIRYPKNELCQDVVSSKDALKCGLSQILKELQEMKRPYHFKIKAGNTIFLPKSEFPDAKYLEEEFSRAQSIDVTPYTLPIYPSNDVLEIWLCVGGECPNLEGFVG